MTATLTEPRPVSPAPPEPENRSGRWEYVALAVLLIGTAAAWFWNLSANNWANPFYSAAVQAGSVSWKAFFFGSSDGANSITVDKTPLSLWPMALSVRAFGLHSWSMLAPQVLMGVGSVALLWATVRRNFGAAAGLLAGLVLAVTPVATLMFRFNNPDAMLVLFMVAAAWAMTRALADGRWRWLVLTGLFIGLGFLAKQLQVLLVVPALALTYLFAGPPALGKRIAQLFAAGAAVLVGAGWWVLIAVLWPVDDRPYFGGSQHNSIIELTLGYNGFGRLTGNEKGSVGPEMGGAAGSADTAGAAGTPGGGGGVSNILWGKPGPTRLFEPAQGGQIAWLIPAAVILLLGALVLRGKAARTDQQRATLLLWGGWLAVTALVFSFMKGIFHQYYTVALAPAIAVLVAAGGTLLWREREKLWVRLTLALALGATTVMAWILLSRSESFLPWLRWVILVAGITATLAVLVHTSRKFGLATATLAVLAGLAAPFAYSADTLTNAAEGPIPSAGPSVRGMAPGGGPKGGPDGNRTENAGNGQGQPVTTTAPTTTAPTTPAPVTGQPNAGQANCPPPPNGAPPNGGPGGPPPGAGAPPNGGPPPGAPANCVPGGNPNGQTGTGATTTAPTTTAPTTAPAAPATGPTGTGDAGKDTNGTTAGGVMMASRPSDRVNGMLLADGDKYTWVAATVSANSAAGFQLATQLPVMPIGGFNGTDPSPTLAQFQKYVQEGKIHYFIGGRQGLQRPGSTETLESTLITQWVKEHYTAHEVDGITLYDLTQPKS
ncbi:glycosyltransferase family 39 protein [Nocardia huaxiensis]|uniref:Glycosyltransferase family 39 protein n=1 Tax=Nocardia huaxiensis TaxID=2755382 RepID=A0A7D6V910_9NOCA|nr:glycosyltransferase family 39 protein [Nocardia huaxiensis]QLY30712.1 glycosyltransferase family 39 protein [Nocardia huaxiensis]UFS94207.1 glycosyltransferase family 39 protein [Nocardia huaxiensis]